MNPQNTNSSSAHCTNTNKDPITGTPSAHPLGVAAGAIGIGAAAGAAGAAIGGPVGAVAGAAAGAVVGAVAGKAVAEAVNPTVETKFWRESHASGPYSHTSFGYEEYAPAYRYGWESFGRRTGPSKTFENLEIELGRGWDQAKGASHLAWDQAKSATRDAWNRVELAARGPATPVAR